MNSIRSGGGSGLRVGSGIGGPLLRSYFAAAGWQFPSSFGGCPSALLEDALEDVFGAPCKSSGRVVIPSPGLTAAQSPAHVAGFFYAVRVTGRRSAVKKGPAEAGPQG